jgi:hypothetical protein
MEFKFQNLAIYNKDKGGNLKGENLVEVAHENKDT